MKINSRTIQMIGNGISILIGAAGVGYGWATQRKMNQVAERLDVTIKDFAKDTNVTIDEALAEAVLKQACEQAAKRTINSLSTEVRSDFRKEIREEVKKEVKAQYEGLKDSVKVEIDRQVNDIDIDEVREKVVKEATEKTMHKLDGCLDTVLDKYNHELNNVGKIYQSIADNFRRT